jgi:hypothetical protein
LGFVPAQFVNDFVGNRNEAVGVVAERRLGHQNEVFTPVQPPHDFGGGLPAWVLAEELFDVLDLQSALLERILLDPMFHARLLLFRGVFDLPVGEGLWAWRDAGQVRVFTRRPRTDVRPPFFGFLAALLLRTGPFLLGFFAFALLESGSGAIGHALNLPRSLAQVPAAATAWCAAWGPPRYEWRRSR